jgi:hypothetical protein
MVDFIVVTFSGGFFSVMGWFLMYQLDDLVCSSIEYRLCKMSGYLMIGFAILCFCVSWGSILSGVY